MNNKKILFAIGIIFLVIVLIEIINIFALFQSNLEGNAKMNNANWHVEVNDVPINQDTSVTFEIGDIVSSTNSHVLEGKIAPRARHAISNKN